MACNCHIFDWIRTQREYFVESTGDSFVVINWICYYHHGNYTSFSIEIEGLLDTTRARNRLTVPEEHYLRIMYQDALVLSILLTIIILHVQIPRNFPSLISFCTERMGVPVTLRYPRSGGSHFESRTLYRFS